MSVNPPLYCYKHPKKETYLRCNNCEKPICSSCAVLTPTGYRCKDCVRGQQKKFDTTRWWDYPVTVIVAGVLSLLFYYLVSQISFIGYFMLILAPVAGIAVAESVRFVVRRRRSKALPWVAAVSAAAGIAVSVLPQLITILAYAGYQQNILWGLTSLLWPTIYAVLSAITVFYRLKGIRL